VVRALARWGTGAVSMLRGMFALAWYDTSRRVLTLARDPLGIKPLLWARVATPEGGEEVVFGSEATALLGHPHLSARPDWGVVSGYLTTIRTTLGSRTMFKAVRELPPGHSGIWRDGRLTVSCDWQPDFSRVERDALPDGAAEERLRAHLSAATRIRLRADVPVGTYLSGGLDSSIVAALAAGERRRHGDAALALPTFSIGFDAAEFDERS
jgi:asparagine synthase (glutamine-hydrolysing)